MKTEIFQIMCQQNLQDLDIQSASFILFILQPRCAIWKHSFHFQTSRAEFDETEYVVRRRYNDFIWLRQKLVEAFPTHLIPVSNM